MRLSILAATLAVISGPALAIDTSMMQGYLEANIRSWAQDGVLVDAIRAQNGMTAGYDAASIDAKDQAWRAEVGTSNTAMIDEVLNNAAADFLRDRVADSGGAITEVFIMDALGLNVAASSVTSDYWQGDEAKFQKTYQVGPDAVHFSEVEFDESSQSYQAQISMTIVDPATGSVLGAMTVGVNADALM